MAIFQLEPPAPLSGASNAGAVGRNRDSELISGFTAWCQHCNRPGRRQKTVPQVVTLIAGSKLPSLLMAGNKDEVCDNKSQPYAKDNSI